jgi:hypothetical protein
VTGVRLGNTLPFGPVWFLGVYLGVVMFTPLTLRLHRRYGLLVPAALIVVAVLVDVLAFAADVPHTRWINLAVVWSLAHQLGYSYADGSLLRAGRRVHLAMALVGLAALIGLTSVGIYPRSMLGTDATFFHLKAIEGVSNMNPPTVCIVALTFWLIGLAMLARGPATDGSCAPTHGRPSSSSTPSS